ncbi:MAG: ABC transporter substrate binding protein [Candidatus Omnitrophica bacterium]|nr:ABC transporter substrate binding protein [Candidatus Omnitrophota bacterium]
MRKFFIMFFIILISSKCFPQDTPETLLNTDDVIGIKTIAFLADDQDEYTDYFFTQIQKELVLLSKDRYSLKFLPNFYCDCDMQGIKDMFRRYLSDPSVDIIVCSGFLSSQVVKDMAPFKKPVIIADLIENEIVPMPYDKGVTGVDNFYYVNREIKVTDDISLFKKIVNFDQINLLVENKYTEYVKKAVETSKDLTDKVNIISVKADVDDILNKIDNVDPSSLFVTFIPLKSAQKEILFSEITKRKIPTFAFVGYFDVSKGALIGRTSKFGIKFARRIALTIDRVIKGEDPGQIPVDFELDYKAVINKRTAQILNVGIPFDILLNADILYATDEFEDLPELTMKKSVEQALENNWNFRILDEQIQATQKDYYLQWTRYLPEVIGYLQYDVIDSERARYSTGTTPKNNFKYGATLNQLIFSDPVIWDIVNSKKQIEVEKLKKQSTELNITEQTLKAYLEYLKVKALKKVEFENKGALETQRKVAQAKYSLGQRGPEDVYRWDAEIAEKKTDILQRDAEILQAKVNLNQLMNHDLEEDFREQDVGLETVSYYIGSSYIDEHIDSAKKVKMLIDLLISDAINDSPEYQALEISIEQQKNNLTVSGNKFLLPEAEIEADLHKNAGSKYYSEQSIRDKDGDWQLGLRVTYPLFDRGSRPVDYFKQKDDLQRLRFSSYLKRQLIEKDLRNAAYQLYFTLLAIDLRREAMINSTKNYDIVVKQYDQGLATITDLIDARNNKFRRESFAVIAVYDFLSALTTFDRQLSDFYIIATDQQRKMWWQKIEDKAKEYYG